ncbi:MAG: PilZ domain-containing protein [Pseudomonadota bacterium]
MQVAIAETPSQVSTPQPQAAPVSSMAPQTMPQPTMPQQTVAQRSLPPQSPQASPAVAAVLTEAQISQLLAVLRLLKPEQVAQVLAQLDPMVLTPALTQLNARLPAVFPKPVSGPPVSGARAQFGLQNDSQRPTERELGAGERKRAQAKAITAAIAEAEAHGGTAGEELPPASPVLTETHSLRPEGGASGAAAKQPASEPKAEDGYSRRISPRKAASNNARIIGTGDRRGVNGEILDISDTGALIRVQADVSLSDRFFLYDFGNRQASDMVAHMPRRSCEIVWRRRNKIGVKFVE